MISASSPPIQPYQFHQQSVQFGRLPHFNKLLLGRPNLTLGKPNWQQVKRSTGFRIAVCTATATLASFLYGEGLHDVMHSVDASVTETLSHINHTAANAIGWVSGKTVEVGGECTFPIVAAKTGLKAINKEKITLKGLATEAATCSLLSLAAHGLGDAFGDGACNHSAPPKADEAQPYGRALFLKPPEPELEPKSIFSKIAGKAEHSLTYCIAPHETIHALKKPIVKKGLSKVAQGCKATTDLTKATGQAAVNKAKQLAKAVRLKLKPKQATKKKDAA